MALPEVWVLMRRWERLLSDRRRVGPGARFLESGGVRVRSGSPVWRILGCRFRRGRRCVGSDRDGVVSEGRSCGPREWHVREPDVVVAHWVGEVLETPGVLARAKIEWAEWGLHLDGHLVMCCAHGYLKGCAPLVDVEGLMTKSLKGGSGVPGAQVEPCLCRNGCDGVSHFAVVRARPPG